MTDRIHIRDLALRCVIGVHPDERRARQDVILNVTLEVDGRPAARTDAIADAVDYKAIKLAIVELVEASSFHLLETLAERVAQICLRSPGVRRVTVTIDKPGALRFARSVAVEITRPRRAAGPRRRPGNRPR